MDRALCERRWLAPPEVPFIIGVAIRCVIETPGRTVPLSWPPSPLFHRRPPCVAYPLAHLHPLRPSTRHPTARTASGDHPCSRADPAARSLAPSSNPARRASALRPHPSRAPWRLSHPPRAPLLRIRRRPAAPLASTRHGRGACRAVWVVGGPGGAVWVSLRTVRRGQYVACRRARGAVLPPPGDAAGRAALCCRHRAEHGPRWVPRYPNSCPGGARGCNPDALPSVRARTPGPPTQRELLTSSTHLARAAGSSTTRRPDRTPCTHACAPAAASTP